MELPFDFESLKRQQAMDQAGAAMDEYAKMLYAYRTSLMIAGFREDQAVYLTGLFMTAMFMRGNNP